MGTNRRVTAVQRSDLLLSSCDVTDVKQGRGRERWEEEERKRKERGGRWRQQGERVSKPMRAHTTRFMLGSSKPGPLSCT
jgi:hypothetical protein